MGGSGQECWGAARLEQPLGGGGTPWTWRVCGQVKLQPGAGQGWTPGLKATPWMFSLSWDPWRESSQARAGFCRGHYGRVREAQRVQETAGQWYCGTKWLGQEGRGRRQECLGVNSVGLPEGGAKEEFWVTGLHPGWSRL